MIQTVTELFAAGLGCVMLAAWRGLPLLAVVLLVDFLFKKRIAPRFQCWLWMLIVVRLLLPVSIESPVSLSGPSDALMVLLWDASRQGIESPSAAQTQMFVLADGRQVLQPWSPPPPAADAVLFHPASANQAQSGLHQPTLGPHWLDIVLFCASWIWAVGALALISRAVIANLRFSRAVRRAAGLEDEQLVAEVARLCKQMNIARIPRVAQLSSIVAPAVFGWWRPVLCFPVQPAVKLSPQELTWVVRHELSHVKGRDALLLTISSVMKALHWFNPLAWIVDAKLKHFVEQAADATATREMPPASVAEYGRLLLRYATAECDAGHPRLVGLLSMASSRGLKKRIGTLGRCQAQGWHARLVAIILLTIVAGTGLTDAASISPKQATSEWVDNQTYKPALPPNHSIDRVRRSVSVDVQGALAKAEQLQPGIDAERFVSGYFLAADNTPKIANGTLSAQLTDFEERLLKQRLRAFERSGAWQISVECRLIQADLKLARDFSWNAPDVKLVSRDSNMQGEDFLIGQVDRWDELLEDESISISPRQAYAPERLRPTLAAKISESEIASFVRSCQESSHGRILLAPKVTCFSGQTFFIADLVERPFVTNVSIATENPQGPLEPTIEVIQEGWSARMCAEATEDGAVELACILRQTEITDVELANLPIHSPADPESDVIVQVPTVQRVSVGSQTQLQVGESLVIMVPRTFRDHTQSIRPPAMFYLFTPRLISDAECLSSFMNKEQ